METFYTIPAFPGYGINRRGEVKSPTGVILTVTERGQVRVKKMARFAWSILATCWPTPVRPTPC